MYNNNQKSKQGFPDPLEPTEVKESKEYGIQYAKAIESQWGKTTDDSSLVGKRNRIFEKGRDYATGVQATSIYKQLLNSLQPNKGDGSLLNIDYTPVPILPKFVRIAGNCLIKGNNAATRDRWKEVIQSVDKNNKFFIFHHSKHINIK